MSTNGQSAATEEKETFEGKGASWQVATEGRGSKGRYPRGYCVDILKRVLICAERECRTKGDKDPLRIPITALNEKLIRIVFISKFTWRICAASNTGREAGGRMS